jgi:ATPase family associated with various cellular activities (AAA)
MSPRWSFLAGKTISRRLASELKQSLGGFHVHVRELPQYRHVDVFRAAEAQARALGITATVESDHRAEYLGALLHAKPGRWSPPRGVNRAERITWATGPDDEVFLPVDVFWICAAAAGRAALLARAHYDANRQRSVIEAASPDPVVAQSFIGEALRRADRDSIYRNRVLALRFEPAARDQYGDVEQPERLRVLFAPEARVAEADVVMDEDVRRLLWRNVIDLHRRRDLLKAHGVPVRRGVLLHGPPGTGKTFACRYLCAQLPDTTRIVVAGSALQQVPAIFSLARLLQPSLVILEDVDLVFTTRDINAQGSILGELLDQMDGLRPHEDVGFVLTTNAIDRIEAAIKDRPGRISQCINLGAPGPDLRRRYLAHYLEPYVTAGVDLGALAARSEGATQAFLKDWVHRAVQVATERLAAPGDKVELRMDDFDVTLREARGSAGTSTRLIGFLAGA